MILSWTLTRMTGTSFTRPMRRLAMDIITSGFVAIMLRNLSGRLMSMEVVYYRMAKLCCYVGGIRAVRVWKIKRKIIKIATLLFLGALELVLTGGDGHLPKNMILGTHLLAIVGYS